MLNVIPHGQPGEAAPLLIAHGLFGSARNWGVIAKRLSDERQVLCVDMRNHAGSPWRDGHRYADLAQDLAEVIEAQGGPVDLLGHSMGGKAAMALALSRPELLRRMIVADIAPLAYDHSQTPLIHAMRAVDLSQVETRAQAEAQLDVEDPTVRAFLLQSLDVRARRWRLNLDALEAEMDHITGWPALNGPSPTPALFLSGGDSDYVSAQGRAEAKRLFPQARFAKIPGAGHWLHAEKPREFEATVRIYLNA